MPGPGRSRRCRQPSGFAVLREWESLERGDVAEAVFPDKETAALCAAVLCLIDREPCFHLEEQAAPGRSASGRVSGDSGVRGAGAAGMGWLRRFNPQIVAALHLMEDLVR